MDNDTYKKSYSSRNTHSKPSAFASQDDSPLGFFLFDALHQTVSEVL